MRARIVLTSTLLAPGTIGVAACGDGDDSTASDATTALETSAAAAGIEIVEPWARTSPMKATNGAVYMVISNDAAEDDAVVGVAVDSTVAARAELHETSEADGAMKMQPIDELAVPAGASVELEPGGYHVMLIDLTAPLVVGETVDVTLEFRNAGEQAVNAEIRESTEGEGAMNGSGDM